MEKNYSFGPGFYEYNNHYVKAIAVLKQQDATWSPHFLLVNIETPFDSEDEARAGAKDDLSEAYLRVAATSNDRAMAQHLSDLGYCRLEE